MIILLIILLIFLYRNKRVKPILKTKRKVKKTLTFPFFTANKYSVLLNNLYDKKCVLKVEDYKYYRILKQNNFGEYPICKLNIKSCKELKELLLALQELEKINKYFNIVVCYDVNLFEIKYLIALYKLTYSKIFFYKRNNISNDLWLAINKFDINNGTNMTIRNSGVYIDGILLDNKTSYYNYCFVQTYDKEGISVKKYDTVLYNKKCLLSKLVISNLSNISKTIKIKYCDEVSINGMFGIKSNIWAKTFDFCAKDIFYYRFNVPYVLSRFCNGIALNSDIKLSPNETKTILIYKTKELFDIDDEDFNNALFLLRQSKKIAVKTDNNRLDNLINNIIPDAIIKNLIKTPFEQLNKFMMFVELMPVNHSVINLSQIYLINNFDVDYYFNLIALLGVRFFNKGIVVSNSVVNGVIIIKTSLGNVVLNINRSDSNCVIINGIEYSNFKQFSYSALVNKQVSLLI